MLYLIALFLLGCGGHMGHKILSGSLIHRPINPMPLMVVSLVAEVAWLGWFIRGFWINWWLPLVGLVAGAIFTGLFFGYSRHGGKAPLLAMAMSLFGFGFTIAAITG